MLALRSETLPVWAVQTLAIRISLRIRRPFLRVRYWRRGLNRPSVSWVLLVGPPVLLVKKTQKNFGHPRLPTSRLIVASSLQVTAAAAKLHEPMRTETETTQWPAT